MKPTKVRKLCEKCGHIAFVEPRRRVCYHRPMGPRMGYSCWGKLVRYKPPARPKVEKRVQDVAAEKLAHARRKVTETTRRMSRMATSLRLWERRAAYYAKRASMTDAEVATEREKTAAAKDARANSRKRRAITLGGGGL